MVQVAGLLVFETNLVGKTERQPGFRKSSEQLPHLPEVSADEVLHLHFDPCLLGV